MPPGAADGPRTRVSVIPRQKASADYSGTMQALYPLSRALALPRASAWKADALPIELLLHESRLHEEPQATMCA